MRARRLFTTVALLLAGCAVFQVPGSSSFGAGGNTGGEAMMPNLIGLSREEAIMMLKAAGFANEPESTRPLECEGAAQIEGRINCQDPESGKLVRKTAMIQINVYRATRINGALVRAQLDALIGLSPDEARAKLKSYGHDGEVKVEPGTKHYDKCGQNKVCDMSAAESGMGIHDDITLYINPGLKIAQPK